VTGSSPACHHICSKRQWTYRGGAPKKFREVERPRLELAKAAATQKLDHAEAVDLEDRI
jgi:hypothetical protein